MVPLGFNLKDMVQEALQDIGLNLPTDSVVSFDVPATLAIKAEINAGVEDSSRRSREIQAQSEVAAAKLFLTL